MLKNFLSRVVGDSSERQVSRLKPIVDEINRLEDRFQAISDVALRELTAELRAQVAASTYAARERVADQRRMIASEPNAQRRRTLEIELENLHAKLDEAEKAALGEVLPRAFAAVREAAKRTIYLRPFDVQLIGGIVLHEGKIAEMRTGEGKTLVATLPAYLNALLGRGVHIVTVNDYLARRDAVWMGALYDLLGLSVGVLQGADLKGNPQTFIYQRGYTRGPYRDLRPVRTRKRRIWTRKGNSLTETWQTVPDRREAYEADITYGTNNEFGFDYLRDNLAYALEDRVQRELYYAIVDEVDNILIDEARTPLIISGESAQSIEDYRRFASIAKKLKPGEDYTFDEKDRYVVTTPAGLAKVEEELGIANIYDDANAIYLHYLEQSLNAEALYRRDRDYIVKGGRVILIDQHTGRLMPDRRLSDGLHQAIEAKEGVKDIRPPMMTNATVTIQNFFRMYRRLAGMTGTAKSEEEELYAIYKLSVVTIPTNVEYQVSHPQPSGPRLVTVRQRQNGTEVITYCREGETRPVFYRRTDYADVIYSTEEAKWQAIVKEIVQKHCAGQPVLVGTTSVEKSEKLAARLHVSMLEMLGRVSLLQEAIRQAGESIEQHPALLKPLDQITPGECDAIARKLELPTAQPTTPENLTTLAGLWGIDDPATLKRVLREGIKYQRWVRDERRRAGTLELDQETTFALLNAKEHAKEAEIIADAGVLGAVTLATSMAGRGVDIQLGGELPDAIRQAAYERLKGRGLDPFQVSTSQFYTVVAEVAPQYVRMRENVLAAGGLFVLGTERHEARRIDNQLRGRAGRQGEPGASRFYISLEDDLMRLFGGDRIKGIMDWARLDRDVPLEHNMLDKTIEQAQTRVEGRNFDIRKHVLEYDDVLNRQRQLIYDQRLRVLTRDDLHDELWEMIEPEIADRLKREFEERPRKQDQMPARREQPLFDYLDSIVPLLYVATSPYHVRNILKGARQAALHAPCLPPFSIMFLAQHIQDTTAETLSETLNDLVERGLKAYQDYLVKRILRAPVEEWVEKRQQHLEEEKEQLEVKIGEFLSWAEEQQEMKGQHQPVTIGQVARHLQKVYPLLKESRLTALRGLRGERDDDPIASADDVLRKLQPDLETAYDRKVISLLIDQVDTGVPRRLQVKWTSALEMADSLQRLAEEALNASDDPRIQRDVERLISDLEAQKPALNNQSALEALRTLNKSQLDVWSVIKAIQTIFESSYQRWSEEQQARLRKAIEDATRETDVTSLEDITQLLLDIYFAPMPTTDRQGRAAMDYALAFLPQFQARAVAAALKPDDRLSAIMATLEQAVALRQQVWGEDRFARQSQETLEQLKHHERQTMVRYWARQLVQEYGEQSPAQWPEAIQEAWQQWEWMRQFQAQPLGQLSNFAQITAHLAETWTADLNNWDDLDAESQAQLEEQAIELGAFANTEAEQQLFQLRLNDLRKEKRDELILALGRSYLEGVRLQTMGELAPEAQAVVRECLRQRGAFTDQARKQRFLVHERLIDLGEQAAQEACQELARRRLHQQRERHIAKETSHDIREAVERALVDSGCLIDAAKQQATLQLSLAQLDPDTLDALRGQLGRMQLAEARRAANGPVDPTLRQEMIAYLKQAHYFVDQARAEAVRQQSIAQLNSTVGELARQSVLAYLDAILRSRAIGEMPDWLQQAINDYLAQCDYFVDAGKLKQWESKTLANLPNAVQAELSKLVSARITDTMADQPMGKLAPDLISAIQRYLDDRQLFRKRAEREAVLEKRLSDLNPTLREELVGFLTRTQLDSLPRKPVADLPGEWGEAARLVLKRSDTVHDHEKQEILPMLQIAELEDGVQRGLEKHLTQEFDGWLHARPISDLPIEVQEQVSRVLDQNEYLLDPQAITAFDVAQLDAAAPVYAGLAQHLGSRLTAQVNHRPLGELEAPTRDRIWQGLQAIGYFYDEDKRRKLLAGTLTDLRNKAPEAYQLVEDMLARQVYQDIARRPVAELTDDQRRELSEHLEQAGYFADQNALTQSSSQKPAALKPNDYEAVAQALGKWRVEPYQESNIGDWPDELLTSIKALLSEQGRVGNQTLLEQFRQQGLAALDAAMRTQLTRWWLDRQTASIHARCLAELDDETRLRVEEFLETQAASSAARSLPADMDREELLHLAGYWARRRLARLAPHKLSSLDPDDQQAIRSFYGWSTWHEHAKNTLLNHISQLWIGYLTRIEDLQQGIGLEAFGQRDPLVEYKRRAFEMFDDLLAMIRRSVVATVFH